MMKLDAHELVKKLHDLPQFKNVSKLQLSALVTNVCACISKEAGDGIVTTEQKNNDFKVHSIVLAYEMGVGQALRDLVNPFPKDSDEFEAYNEGVKFGKENLIKPEDRMVKESELKTVTAERDALKAEIAKLEASGVTIEQVLDQIHFDRSRAQ